MGAKRSLALASRLRAGAYAGLRGLKPILRAAPVDWLVRPYYGGIGSVLMFHSIVERAPKSPIECDFEVFKRIVEHVPKLGYQCVSLDQLAGGEFDPRRRVMVFTFDDGYRNNADLAWPYLHERSIPFTIYVTTGFLRRCALPWWLLSDWFHDDGVTESDLRRSFAWTDEASFAEVAAKAYTVGGRESVERIEEAARRDFGELIQKRFEAEFLDDRQVSSLAGDSLVTIGNHSHTHPVFKGLSEVEIDAEFETCNAILRGLTDRAVKHFSFPYGSRSQVGSREVGLAEAHGFATIATTRTANLFPKSDTRRSYVLPRIAVNSTTSLRDLELKLSGLVPMVMNLGRRVPTD